MDPALPYLYEKTNETAANLGPVHGPVKSMRIPTCVLQCHSEPQGEPEGGIAAAFLPICLRDYAEAGTGPDPEVSAGVTAFVR